MRLLPGDAMKLFISAVTWDQALRAGMSQAELASEAVALGCCGVEFRQYWKEQDEIPAAAAALAGSGLLATYACNEGLLADSRENTLKLLAAANDDLTVAAALGAKLLRLNVAAGQFDSGFIAADWWHEAVVTLLARAAGLGIPLAVENGPDPVKSDVTLLASLLGRFESPWLRLTFDTGNWLYAGVAPAEALAALARYVGCVHLKDIVAGADGLKHRQPGTGIVDIRSLVRKLTAGGYAGPFVLEFPGGDDPRGRVRGSLAYLTGLA